MKELFEKTTINGMTLANRFVPLRDLGRHVR